MKKIEYAIISNNQNPEYTELFPFIQKRWNDLGIKTVYVDCHDDNLDTHKMLDQHSEPIRDNLGNLKFVVNVPRASQVLDRYFHIMISRFFVAGLMRQYTNEIVMISDGDLFPINKKYIFRPAYNCNPSIQLSNEDWDFIATNQYPNGDHLATYIYGTPQKFDRLLGNPYKIVDVYKSAEMAAYKIARMYMNDEHFINYKFKELGMKVFNPGNRKWIAMCQDMNNLYDFQIDLLGSSMDLSPFIEFHNMRASTMTDERWSKLFHLLHYFDEARVTPNNYFYPSIENPWRDTLITKDGQLLLGDEYD